MKFILLLVTILFAGTLFAQDVPPEQKFPKTRLGILPPFGLHKNKVVVSTDATMLAELKRSDLLKSRAITQPQDLSMLPNGNRVIILPQDNMPCIVPNENGNVIMPNVSALPTVPYRYKGPGAIPNPAMPILIEKPKKK